MRKFLIAIAFTLLAGSAFAAPTDLFAGYEHARQGLIKASVAEVQAGAKHLAMAARGEKQNAIAQKADALAAAKDIKAARAAFAAVSNEMISFRKGVKGDRPVVVYCTMEKKSWLQPKGAISNPYVDAGMRGCGEVKEQ